MAGCDESASFLEHWTRCEAAEGTGDAPSRRGADVAADRQRAPPRGGAPGPTAAPCRPRALRRSTAAAGLLSCGAALALVALCARGSPQRRDGLRARRAHAALGALVLEEAVPPAAVPTSKHPEHACPGSVDVQGFGNVSVVAAQFGSPGVPGAEVKLTRAAGGGRGVQPSMRGKAYFASGCTADSFDPAAYVSWKLLGKRLRYHTHVQGAGCGCNAALYLVGMPQNAAAAGSCNDYFCDAHSTCGVACSHIVVQDANQYAWSSSLHVSDDPDGTAVGYGGGANYDGLRDWTDVEYSPTGVIATASPLEVVVSFPADASGALKAVEVALLQDGGGRALSANITSYKLKDHRDGLREMTAALEAGLTPVINYYSSSELSWLDGRGLDAKGPCAEELPAECASSVRFFNFSIEDIGGEATSSSSTASSTLTTTTTSTTATTTTRTITRTLPPVARTTASTTTKVARTTTSTITKAPFDCLANLSTFEEDWFLAKAVWCCRNMRLGCIDKGQRHDWLAKATIGADAASRAPAAAAAPASTAADPAAATPPASAAPPPTKAGSTASQAGVDLAWPVDASFDFPPVQLRGPGEEGDDVVDDDDDSSNSSNGSSADVEDANDSSNGSSADVEDANDEDTNDSSNGSSVRVFQSDSSDGSSADVEDANDEDTIKDEDGAAPVGGAGDDVVVDDGGDDDAARVFRSDSPNGSSADVEDADDEDTVSNEGADDDGGGDGDDAVDDGLDFPTVELRGPGEEGAAPVGGAGDDVVVDDGGDDDAARAFRPDPPDSSSADVGDADDEDTVNDEELAVR